MSEDPVQSETPRTERSAARRRTPDPAFWEGKRVLVTGHTGFVGSWAARWLQDLGAQVSGASLPVDEAAEYADPVAEDGNLVSHALDLRDAGAVAALVADRRPELVLHLAGLEGPARAGRAPSQAFAVNVMGTVNLLEALREQPDVQAVLAVTSDCIYLPTTRDEGNKESDPLGSQDPYTASKAACDAATESFARSCFEPRGVAVGRARGGALIGGGDYSPESPTLALLRGAESGKPVVLSHPYVTRPWLHVVDGVAGYLVYLEMLATDPATPRVLNFGPPPGGRLASLAELAEAALESLGSNQGWLHDPDAAGSEALRAELDTTAAYQTLGIDCALDPRQAIAWAADWRRAVAWGAEPGSVTLAQIRAYDTLS